MEYLPLKGNTRIQKQIMIEPKQANDNTLLY